MKVGWYNITLGRLDICKVIQFHVSVEDARRLDLQVISAVVQSDLVNCLER